MSERPQRRQGGRGRRRLRWPRLLGLLALWAAALALGYWLGGIYFG